MKDNNGFKYLLDNSDADIAKDNPGVTKDEDIDSFDTEDDDEDTEDTTDAEDNKN